MLLHDGVEGSASEVGQDRRQTVAAVARIVEAARSRGLSFVTLPA
jgi:peptidoglycan/xylan/chitin deacetylase (PgdA/CDA1 family)